MKNIENVKEKNICDYTGFDYKKVFWEGQNREYEDICEKQSISKLLRKINLRFNYIMDAGCGYGRLFPSYSNYGEKFIFLDYAENLLNQAKKDMEIKFSKNTNYIRGNMYNIPLKDNSVDLVISIRTLHHMDQLSKFFAEANRVLNKKGYFLFEIPNKRHLLNIFKYVFKKSRNNPFSKENFLISDHFYNYHPATVMAELNKNGFVYKEKIATSFFRSQSLKKYINNKALVWMDSVFQNIFSFTDLTPSIYILCQKH